MKKILFYLLFIELLFSGRSYSEGKIWVCSSETNPRSFPEFVWITTHEKISATDPDSISNRIKLNQVGYYPNEEKIAIITGKVLSHQFFILSSKGHTKIFTGKLDPNKTIKSKYSSTLTQRVDFSNFQKPGTYQIFVPGVGRSYSFSIKNHVYHNLGIASLKAFYFQRVSMNLEPKFAGIWSRAEGHPDTLVFVHSSAADINRPKGTKIKSPGGWYDAGDYNKYIVNSGISTATLLSAYEDFPSYYDSLKTNIPESGNSIPDILNEALYNIRWMLTMQDPNDGGVYHKCTNAEFDPMIMPNQAVRPRFVVQKSTAASLDFAAVMAQTSRILNRFHSELPGLSDSCMNAAVKAWNWSLKNPMVLYDQNLMNKTNSPPIRTGDYGDQNLTDEWFWASAELYTTSVGFENSQSIQPYLEKMKESTDQTQIPSWSNVGMLGYYSLVRNQNLIDSKHLPGAPTRVFTKTNTLSEAKNLKNPETSSESIIREDSKIDFNLLKARIKDLGDRLIQNQKENAFGTIIGQSKNDFVWGSNAVAANQGIELVNAYLITHEKKYLKAALSNVDYLLGRNATGYCFITGTGSKSPMHPHHRPSIADGIKDPIPGLLVGGPNPGMQDGKKYAFMEPETAYTDQDGAYASNEIAINWNAPFAYLINATETLNSYSFTHGKKMTQSR